MKIEAGRIATSGTIRRIGRRKARAIFGHYELRRNAVDKLSLE